MREARAAHEYAFPEAKTQTSLSMSLFTLLSSIFLTLYSHFVLAERYGVHHAHFQEGHQQVEPGRLYVYTSQYAFQRV